MSNEQITMSLVGEVKWFDNHKGWGFIVGEGLPDVFVHYSEVQMEGFRSLRQGESVLFDLAETPKGLQARNVRHADGTPQQVAV